MRKTPRSSRDIITIAFFILVPVVILALMNDGQNQGRGQIIASTPISSNSGNDPSLSGGNVNASFGYANITTFNFTITYQSTSNSPPTSINVTLIHKNSTTTLNMQKVTLYSSAYSTGVQFYNITTIPATGNYSFFYLASNNVSSTRYPALGTLAGPGVVQLRNYNMSGLSYKWLDSSSATELGSADQIYNYNLENDFTMYGRAFSLIQVSYYGFLRFFLSDNTNYNSINISTNDVNSSYAIIASSDKIWNQLSHANSYGSSDLYVLNNTNYFLVQQDVALYANGTDYWYGWDNGKLFFKANYQYVFYKNGSILLNYNYITHYGPFSESVGLNFGDGIHYTAYSFSSNITNESLLFNYNYVNSTHVLNYSLSPLSGKQVTTFNFTLDYQNLENRAPYSITLGLDGKNYSMNPVNNNILNYVVGEWYSFVIQFLSPNFTHSYNFSLVGPDGYWHSPVINGPLVTISNITNYIANPLFNFVYYSPKASWNTISLNSMKSVAFNFSFYGFNFTSLVVSTGGFLKFGKVTSSVMPTPGSENDDSWLSINILGDTFLFASNSTVTYQTFGKTLVVNYYNIGYTASAKLGDFQIILNASGEIIFSFFDLEHVNALNPGGINYGDGLHYNILPLTQADIPLTNQSFIFSHYRPNSGISTKITPSGSLFKTSQQILFNASCLSTPIPLSRVYCIISGVNFQQVAYPVSSKIMSRDQNSFINCTTGAIAIFKTTLPTGIYNVSYRFNDIYNHAFTTTSTFNFVVHDPPIVTEINPLVTTGTDLYGGVGRLFTIQVDFNDSEGLPPAYLKIQWDGINYTMNHTSSDYSTIVLYTASFNLTHGAHEFSVFYKDQYWPNQFFVYKNQNIIARYVPVITIVSLPPTMIYNPYVQYQISVTITCPEPGPYVLTKYVSIDGKTNITLTLQSGSSNTYIANVNLGDGQHTISIIASDSYNTVTWPVSGTTFTVTVIDLPLILGIIIPIAVVASLLIIYQIRKKKQKSIQQDMLKKQVLAKKARQRIVPGDIEVKNKARQKESEAINATDAIPVAASVVKKSAAVRKVATSGQPTKKAAPTSIGHQKPAAAGRSHPRDKSKFAPRMTDTTTIINRTILKDYIERQRKNGIKELHFIKIKNDLNIISQNKSSRLYRLLKNSSRTTFSCAKARSISSSDINKIFFNNLRIN